MSQKYSSYITSILNYNFYTHRHSNISTIVNITRIPQPITGPLTHQLLLVLSSFLFITAASLDITTSIAFVVSKGVTSAAKAQRLSK